MGQKVNPYGLRIGINKPWKSKWYLSNKEYRNSLQEDLKIRFFLLGLDEVIFADVSEVEIFRQPHKIIIVLSTPRPGILIGVKGGTIDTLNKKTQKRFAKKIEFKVKEVKKPEIQAQNIAQNIAKQIRNRVSYKKAVRQALNFAQKGGIEGVKIKTSGRLDGAEIARSFEQKSGKVPLHTLRANIDYGFTEAKTTYGVIGIKVWTYNGDVLDAKASIQNTYLADEKMSSSRERHANLNSDVKKSHSRRKEVSDAKSK